MIRQDLLLVFYNRVLVPQNPGLIAEQLRESLLIVQDLSLIRDDNPIIRDKRPLVLEGRLCHCLSFYELNVRCGCPALLYRMLIPA